MKFLHILVITLSGLAFVIADGSTSDRPSSPFVEPKYCLTNSKDKDYNDYKCETSKIAGIEADPDVAEKLTDYAWNQIVASYDHLLLSVTFDSFTKDRPGFEKLYRDLSDAAWKKSIELIKYVTKRGGKINKYWDLSKKSSILSYIDPLQTNTAFKGEAKFFETTIPVLELRSLGEAIEIEKALSKTAYAIHNEVQSHHKTQKKDLDAGVAHYLEEEFIEGQADTIRKLVGYYNDFKTITGGKDDCSANKNVQLACYMFDEYLRKQ
jgi:ferritin heavy chain